MEKFLRPEKIKRFLDQKKLKDFWTRKNQKIFGPEKIKRFLDQKKTKDFQTQSEKTQKGLKKQQQKKAIFSILSPNSNIHENHERLQFFFSSCMAISNVLPWQYQGYVHRNVKASLAISRLLPWQYQGYVHRNIKATPMALSNFRGNVKATSIPWQYHGYFHQPVSRQPTAAVVQAAIIIIFQLFPQYSFHSKKQNT